MPEIGRVVRIDAAKLMVKIEGQDGLLSVPLDPKSDSHGYKFEVGDEIVWWPVAGIRSEDKAGSKGWHYSLVERIVRRSDLSPAEAAQLQSELESEAKNARVREAYGQRARERAARHERAER